MAALTQADVRAMWRNAYQTDRAKKDLIKADGPLPDRTQMAAVFQAVEDWYSGLNNPKQTEVQEVANPPISAERQRLRDLRAALADLRDQHATMLATLTNTDPVDALRTEIKAEIASLQITVDGETRPPTKIEWWTAERTTILPLISAAFGRAVSAQAGRVYTQAWMEVRLG